MEPDYIKKSLRLRRIINDDLTHDIFRSEVCHMHHFDGDTLFYEKILGSHAIDILWEKEKYFEALYLLAYIDYLTDKHNLPLLNCFEQYRKRKLSEIVYPSETLMLDELFHTDEYKKQAVADCQNDASGKFFIRHNIIEVEVEDYGE